MLTVVFCNVQRCPQKPHGVDLLQGHQQASPIPVVALRVGSVGQIDFASGRVVLATSALSGWPGTCLKSAFGAELGLPTFVENDVNAAAYGEYRLAPRADIVMWCA
jgi:predicted NBD/HSP70 family sugar kinase